MVVLNKAVELELGALLRLHLPEQKGPEGISLHEAVEQSANLIGLPDELSLDSRQHV
jgi:hypothetical protein